MESVLSTCTVNSHVSHLQQTKRNVQERKSFCSSSKKGMLGRIHRIRSMVWLGIESWKTLKCRLLCVLPVILVCSFIIYLCVCVCLFEAEREEERRREIDLPSTLHSCLIQGWARLKPWSRKSTWISHLSGRNTTTWPIICCVPGTWAESWIWRRGARPGTPKRCLHPKEWLNQQVTSPVLMRNRDVSACKRTVLMNHHASRQI